ncbi:MAG: hypothetical protein CMN31_15035 [Sandaracinus sp.]|nr:hypothetical protein [Myxococcales bacterium]MAT26790.1 hypothetical protein [Sandaracinus sp.]MBJ72627.1 hypothetical protein [Sandaracinus sp.]HJL04074.1 transglutaminase domain-containing protein [Polyangiaceae bacterium LLY-WYZ-15_(1-7)]HJL35621.1 transglutaminase domain-containing protein [Polyangiaceae bacterium LLY-WYZ-15_(1-7)]
MSEAAAKPSGGARPDGSMPDGEPAREGWMAIAARALVLAIGGAVFTIPLGADSAIASAGLGAFTGACLGPALARTRLRSGALVGTAALVLLVALAVRWLALDTGLLAPSLGPASALRLGDALFFFLALAGVAMGLRALSARRRALAVLEVSAVGLAFAQLVVAHRQGMIHRPYEYADEILAAGGDPTHYLFLLGGAATAVIVLLLLGERRPTRWLLHLGAVTLLLGLFLWSDVAVEPPEPPPGAMGLGLRPGESDSEDESEGRGGGGGGETRPDDEDLEFKDELDQSRDHVPVAVVLFRDDFSPPYGTYYFRQGAFSQYNGRRLVGAVAAGADEDLADTFPTAPYDVDEPPPMGAHRATVETTVALLTEHSAPFGLEAPVRLEPWPNPDPDRFRRTYNVFSAALTADFASMIGARAGDPRWSEEERQLYTAPPEDPRYRELAERILEETLPEDMRDDPAARVAAVTSWLGQEGSYSLRSNHAGAEDPTAHFLFGDLTGYCVHFAHAATFLLRTLGLPTRVATGYAIPESARRGGSALLISGDTSHAWPEVYLEGFGWVVADVSPQTVLSPPPPPPDPELQNLLGELARGLDARPPDPEAPLPRFATSMRDVLVWLGLGLLALGVGFLVFLIAAKLWRRLAPRFATEDALPRLSYRAALDQLSELSLRRAKGESREAFAARVKALAPSFEALTRTHVGVAFGSRRARAAAAALEEQRRALGRELAAAFPWWRRALGRLSPWTWLTSR